MPSSVALHNDLQALARQMHDAGLDPESRVVRDSTGHGWANIHAVVTSRRNWAGTLSQSPHLALGYCLSKVARIRRRIGSDERWSTHTLYPRHFSFLPMHAETQFKVEGDADVLVIYVHRRALDAAAERFFGRVGGHWRVEPRIGVQDAFLEQCVLQVLGALERVPDPAEARYVDELAVTMAAHLIRMHMSADIPAPRRAEHRPAVSSASASASASLERARILIDERLEEPLGLPRLAQAAGLDVGAFCRAFRHAYHETPHRYVLRRRVERTRQLLIDSDLPISEIALQTGFASQAHLSTVFKKMTGQTPARFRNPRADNVVRPRTRNSPLA